MTWSTPLRLGSFAVALALAALVGGLVGGSLDPLRADGDTGEATTESHDPATHGGSS